MKRNNVSAITCKFHYDIGNYIRNYEWNQWRFEFVLNSKGQTVTIFLEDFVVSKMDNLHLVPYDRKGWIAGYLAAKGYVVNTI